MSVRITAPTVGLITVVVFWFVRPDVPASGSDCEVLTTGALREPTAALSAVAIVAAGWLVVATRLVPGVALLFAGSASVAAHATAHPTARALDGIAAVVALAAVVWSIARHRPEPRRLAAGLAIGTAAVVVWVLTRTDAPLCDTVGPWGHAAWHVLVATAVVVTFHPNRTDD